MAITWVVKGSGISCAHHLLLVDRIGSVVTWIASWHADLRVRVRKLYMYELSYLVSRRCIQRYCFVQSSCPVSSPVTSFPPNLPRRDNTAHLSVSRIAKGRTRTRLLRPFPKTKAHTVSCSNISKRSLKQDDHDSCVCTHFAPSTVRIHSSTSESRQSDT